MLKREVFVSESIMVSSGDENRAVLIEVSPKNFGVYEVPNSDELICSNHFQSDAYQDDRRNQKTIEESHSKYRYDRMKQLVEQDQKLDVPGAVAILRDMKGVDDEALGYGNEKAVNQLLAHHGIVFQPKDRKVWVSANPYQMGAFVAYDLKEVFKKFENGNVSQSLVSAAETLPKSPFLETEEFQDYEHYRKLEQQVKIQLENEETISEGTGEKLIALNPEFWEAYFLAGKMAYEQKNFNQALQYFEQARTKVVTTKPDLEQLDKMIRKTKRRL